LGFSLFIGKLAFTLCQCSFTIGEFFLFLLGV